MNEQTTMWMVKIYSLIFVLTFVTLQTSIETLKIKFCVVDQMRLTLKVLVATIDALGHFETG